MKKIVQTKHAPAAIGPYSQAIVSGNLVFISGQIPLDPLTGLYNPSSPKEEADIALKHIGAILKEIGLTYENIVKVTIYLNPKEKNKGFLIDKMPIIEIKSLSTKVEMPGNL